MSSCSPPAAADLLAGLTSVEVAQRRARDGPNELPRPDRKPAFLQLLAQWTHFFAILLWVAAVLAAVAGMPQLAVAIAVVVLINGVFAFIQEHRGGTCCGPAPGSAAQAGHGSS